MLEFQAVRGTTEGREMEMTKAEVKEALDRIREMSGEEIALNCVFIKKVSEAAFSLIKTLERRKRNGT